jgi:hypothetical protein
VAYNDPMNEPGVSHLPASPWSDEDTARAKEIWAAYQQEHDLSSLVGQTAGVDPWSGRVWIGESAVDVAHQRNATGSNAPLYLVRVGFDYFVRKGRR